MRRALADRRLELGTIKALAAELGLSESATSRLLKNGPPRSWDDARLTAFAERLYARAHAVSKERSPAERDLIQAKRKAPVFSDAARVAAARQLAAYLVELEGRRACERGSWTPRAELARELSATSDLEVTSVKVGRWIRAGRVSEEGMAGVHEWAQQRAETELRKIALQSRLDELIQASKKPALAPSLAGAKQKQAARAPDMKTTEGPTDSDEQSGYQWVLRIEEWSSFALIERMCQWALGRQRKGPMARPANRWIVTAFLSLYEPPDAKQRRPDSRRGKRIKSPGPYRQFEAPRDREIGRNLQLGAVISSGLVTRGGLEHAVNLFREYMTGEHCDHELLFVHSVLVRNWRLRGAEERKARRARANAKFMNELALKEKAKAARDAKVRESARKKALGRGRSRAGGARPRGKKKPT